MEVGLATTSFKAEGYQHHGQRPVPDRHTMDQGSPTQYLRAPGRPQGLYEGPAGLF